MTNQWIEVCAIDDIPTLGARVLRRQSGPDIAMFRTASDKVYAILDRCPHKGGPLSQGIVFEDRVTCPLHNWNIRLESGEAVEPDEGCARVFAVRLDGARVLLDAGQLRANGSDELELAR